ncbi:MAG TPA: aminoacyl-histidine dipeptidase [Acidobacteriota bacterium]|jgi:dipeptidase D|nr:aminoacyl-histidine dipeptidase [Acidobacteriota bacterium]HNT18435.1 aminoacyl-histidine dipeptidase [Acidobacteriota bacterium]HPA26724.1 aminoacyl-histidine dipeptidase [Acidobacteriota bacterium]HQO20241.1 aminoacyl-histidine dipeptidase [Acidobacteriota bacterium]HQQ46916.1 aminoacyl-histidine dipeptidase [Acidobacteriota bacterium]
MVVNKEPVLVWRYFEELSAIPRPSGHEKAAADWIAKTAKEHGLPFKKDKVGNVMISIPGTASFEKAPAVVLQGHLDMVPEKNHDSKHDFLKDPIGLKVEGDWLKARGTTLGADNGIGVAMALALLDDKKAQHGPLELLFTIDEERGLKGANSLSKDFVKGRRLINVDTEEEGAIYIGCAGGVDTALEFKVSREKKGFSSIHTLMVTGLRGGHSGSEIHEGRGNANQLLARILLELEKHGIEYFLHEISGGSKRNAIPREAFAKISVKPSSKDKLKKLLKKLTAEFRFELRGIDEKVSVSLKDEKSVPVGPISKKSRTRLLWFLSAIPHGPLAFDREIPGLVETSANFAIVETSAKSVKVHTSQRSSVWSKLQYAAETVRNLGLVAGAKAESSGMYHGWTPNLSSALLLQAKKTYKRISGKDAEDKAIHAGLECGILGERYPGMDMISMGPDIRNAHSPDEMVSIPSVERTYLFLKELLKDLAEAR